MKTLEDLYEYMDKQTLEKCIKCRNFARDFEQSIEAKDTLLSDACSVSDIGMTFISPTIKNKPGKLLPSEMELINAHPYFGYQILMDNGFEELALITSCHQKWKYEEHFKDIKEKLTDNIRKIALQVCTIDVYIALINDRPYREALQPLEAYKLMQNNHENFDSEILRFINKQIVDAI